MPVSSLQIRVPHLSSCCQCLLVTGEVCHTCLHAVNVIWLQLKCVTPVFMLSMSVNYRWSVPNLSSCSQCHLVTGATCHISLNAVSVCLLTTSEVLHTCLHTVNVCLLITGEVRHTCLHAVSVIWLHFMLSVSFGSFIPFVPVCWLQMESATPVFIPFASVPVDYRWSVPHFMWCVCVFGDYRRKKVCHTCLHTLCVCLLMITGEVCHTCLHAVSAPGGWTGYAAHVGVLLQTMPWPGVHCVAAQHTPCTDRILQGLRERHTVCRVGARLRPGDPCWQDSLQRRHCVDVQHA